MDVSEDRGKHVFMDKQKTMRPCVESIGNFGLLSLLIDDAIDHVDDLFGKVIEVENRWVCIKADRVEAIAILNKNRVTLMMSSANSL